MTTTEQKIIELAKENRQFRVTLARLSHYWFFHLYLNSHVMHPTAAFQKEIFALTQDSTISLLAVTAFRGSSKTTICATSLPIWAIVGVLELKFVVVVARTQQLANTPYMAIKRECEQNTLLKRELGPFREESDQWGGHNLYFPKYNALIAVRSFDQHIRGIKHQQYRPQLIIVDDIEDMESVRVQAGRDKVYRTFKGDILPAGDDGTKVVVTGNLLHEDGLLRRLEREIQAEKLSGIFRSYPLVDEKEQILWPGKYPDMDTIRKKQKFVGDEMTWQREYLLKIVPEGDQVVHKEWIHFYDVVPENVERQYRETIIAVDPAISEKDTADRTAIVTLSLYGYGNNHRVYMHPHPINKKMDFPTTLAEIGHCAATTGKGSRVRILVEGVAYQTALKQQLEQNGLWAQAVKIGTADKRTRLASISPWIKSGKVLFPTEGCEELITQLVGFGVERYNDLADALVLGVTYAIKNGGGPRAVAESSELL